MRPWLCNNCLRQTREIFAFTEHIYLGNLEYRRQKALAPLRLAPARVLSWIQSAQHSVRRTAMECRSAVKPEGEGSNLILQQPNLPTKSCLDLHGTSRSRAGQDVAAQLYNYCEWLFLFASLVEGFGFCRFAGMLGCRNQNPEHHGLGSLRSRSPASHTLTRTV